MARTIADYVALALISSIDWRKDDDDVFGFGGYGGARTEFAGDLAELKDYAEKRCGVPLTETIVTEAMRTLVECGLLRVTDDDFSGTYIKIKRENFKGFIERANEQFAEAERAEEDAAAILLRPSDFPAASAYLKHELIEDYAELGDAWLRRALEGMQKRYQEDGRLSNGTDAPAAQANEVAGIPASDRIVTLADNQVAEFDKQSSALIEAVSSQNQIDSPGLRELLLGQLKAGRELLRAGSFRTYVLEVTLFETLRFLAAKYDKEIIGSLANALMTALAAYIGTHL